MTDTLIPFFLALVRTDRTAAARPADGDWPRLVALAADRDVLGLVATRIARDGPAPPPAAAAALEHALTRARRRIAWCSLHAARALEALERAGIAAVAIKGTVLAHLVYDDPAERSLRDVDLLVAPADVDRALEVLAGVGWRPVTVPALALYRRHHFHAVLEGDGLPPLELHWALTRPDDPQRLEAAGLLAEREALVRPSGTLRAPRPEAHVLVAAASSLRDGFTEFKPLVDLDRLARRGLPLRWDRIADDAARAGLAAALRLLVESTARLLGTPLAEALAALPELPPRTAARLARLGAHELPLAAGPGRGRLAPHLVRTWLSPDPRRCLATFVRRNAFERACQREAGTGVLRRGTGLAGRLLQLAEMSAWRVVRRLAPHRL